MGFFRFPWLRRMLRRHTTPIPYRKATRWRDRMSIAYLLVCWNLFGYLGKFDFETAQAVVSTSPLLILIGLMIL